PSIADVSWVEYEFVRDVPKPSEFLKHVARYSPRILSVEVLPGVVCHMRLTEDGTVQRSPQRLDAPRTDKQHAESRPANELIEDAVLARAIEQLERASSSMRDVLRQMRASVPSAPGQSSLLDH